MNVKLKDLRDLITFFKTGQKIEYKKGEIIIRPEDPPQGVYFVSRGHIKTYGISDDGNVRIHAIKSKGDIFPLIWAFTGDQRPLYYEAMDTVIVYRIAKRKLLDLVKGQPRAMEVMLHQMINLYRTHDDRIENLEYRSAYERVVYRLLYLAEHFGRKRLRKVVINAPIRHHDIADSINVSRETASREMSKLEQKGLVAYEKGLIVINSTSKLRAELS